MVQLIYDYNNNNNMYLDMGSPCVIYEYNNNNNNNSNMYLDMGSPCALYPMSEDYFAGINSEYQKYLQIQPIRFLMAGYSPRRISVRMISNNLKFV